MKISVLTLLSLIVLGSCSNREPKVNEVVKLEYVEADIPLIDNFEYDTLQGIYSGDFGGSDIRIILNYVSATKVIGYNIHKGLQRNINGTLTKDGKLITMSLPEPGDHEYDGVFQLNFTGIDKKPKAQWVSNSGKIPSKKFTLKKIEAPSDKNEGVNSSNFAEYFYYVYDTIGNYHFESDGFCLFEYYPKKENGGIAEQLIEVKGTWSLHGDEVTIDWQENKIFPSQKMMFKVIKNEYEEYLLKGEDRTLYHYFY